MASGCRPAVAAMQPDEPAASSGSGKDDEKGSVVASMLPSSQGDAADVSDGSQEPDSNFITEQWVKQLSFVKVRQCKLCHHSSNEINPLRRGPFKRSTRWPVWPWLQGTYALPRGSICRVCQYVFSLGGFQEQHGDTMTLVKKQAESDTLTKEFSVCAAKMIDLINAGEVSMRCRGNKRSAVEASLAESRKRTVELIKSEALRVKDKFKAIMLSQWEAENPGKDAREEGYAVKSLQVPGQESPVPCVLMRKGPKTLGTLSWTRALLLPSTRSSTAVRLPSGQASRMPSTTTWLRALAQWPHWMTRLRTSRPTAS